MLKHRKPFWFFEFYFSFAKKFYGNEEKNNRCGYNPVLGKWG